MGAAAAKARARTERLLLWNVLIVAAAALVYQLVCGTLASYLLGNAVREFSLVLGTYLFAMGAGAWLSRRFEPEAARRYVEAEIALAVVGGLSVPLLLLAESLRLPIRPALYALVFVIGALVGLELPLLVKILGSRRAPPEAAGPAASGPAAPGSPTESASPTAPTETAEPEAPVGGQGFADTVGRALAYDYAGGLAASLLFPLVLVPGLGLARTAIAAGLLNVLVALSATFTVEVERRRSLRAVGVAVACVLAFAFVRSEAWIAQMGD